MRAVQSPPRKRPLPRQPLPSLRRPVQQPTVRTRAGAGPFLGYAVSFLVGYLPGLLAGRGGESSLSQQLAAYYLDAANFSSWTQVFSAQMSAAFLQLLAVILCGFCAFGGAFLVLVFAGRGMFLGFCAASILSLEGARALALYWLMVCLPGLAVLFVSLWLASHAVQLSNGLFQSVFLGGAPRGRLSACARRLLVRGGTALLLCVLFSLIGTGLDLFVVRVLL